MLKLVESTKTKSSSIFKNSFHLEFIGWLNDPNGLCQFNGVHHIYFQYSFNPKGGLKHWGHVYTNDFIHYKNGNIFLRPDSEFDKSGAYSGSAFIKDGQSNFFYTGNVKHEGDFDYINSGREHNVVLVTSTGDLTEHSEKTIVLRNKDFPEDFTCHVRDPKIVQQGDMFYMILGGRNNKDEGEILCYKSSDLRLWKFNWRFNPKTDENGNHDFGYMIECPDFVSIGDNEYFITCPQGAKRTTIEPNVYQCKVLHLNKKSKLNSNIKCSNSLENGDFSIESTYPLDYGFEFYAPQTYIDEIGRTILIGWLGMPDSYTKQATINLDNVSDVDYQHCLTIPRELHIIENRLCQRILPEFRKLIEPAFVQTIPDTLGVQFNLDNFYLNYSTESRNSTFYLKLSDHANLTYSPLDGLFIP